MEAGEEGLVGGVARGVNIQDDPLGPLFLVFALPIPLDRSDGEGDKERVKEDELRGAICLEGVRGSPRGDLLLGVRVRICFADVVAFLRGSERLVVDREGRDVLSDRLDGV